VVIAGVAVAALALSPVALADDSSFISTLDSVGATYRSPQQALKDGYVACDSLHAGVSVQAAFQNMHDELAGHIGSSRTGTAENYFLAAARELCPDQWGRVSAAMNSDVAPTITNPQGIRTVIMGDVYALICNDLDANGVSVPSVRKIHYVLMDDPQYQYTAHDAGTIVANAVETTCPKYKSALMEAARQALS
jgi:hypothetical protein